MSDLRGVLVLGAVAVLSVAYPLQAQPAHPPAFERFTTEHGLSFHSITSIVQDRQGFLWIGTLDGLNRFDGYTFTTFRHDAADSSSMIDDYVNVVHEDRAGMLWIGTSNGLNRYDPATDGFVRYRYDGALPAAGPRCVGSVRAQ